MNSSSLYQEVILDHNKKPRNWGSLSDPTHRAEGVNPLCGDNVTLMLKVSDGSISEIAVEGESCAICKASASMMTTSIKGKSVDLAERLATEFRQMVTGQSEGVKRENLGRLKVFQGIKDLPSRIKCAVLPWHTLHAAVNSIDQVSTEGSDDPLS
tara:strand:+ start:159 stop:623 length:465 start_codon:yes stop_codon:yes gene_type:complete